MKNNLAKFSEFANSLYPHEVEYLLSIQNFSTQVNLQILKHIQYNIKNSEHAKPFESEIDKRKYSYLKNWIETKLSEIDVDHYYDWLIGIEKKIMTDSIMPEEERDLLQRTKTSKNTHYYFIRFYELLQYYRDYLLIRVRNKYHAPVSEYLRNNEAHYNYVTDLNTRLNAAAVDIVMQHDQSEIQSRQWEEFLLNTFFDSTIDGYTRYRALVRLTFLYYNYREFDKLKTVYNKLDDYFKCDIFYSKRILSNYYANRGMMHSKLNELTEAERYGYLSIRQKNSDYLFYLISLCGVLLKRKKQKEALEIMTASMPEIKKTESFYNKIGFVAFYIRTLVANNLVSKAVSYAETYLEAYKKEIMMHRWHLFFSAYFQALTKAEKYEKVLSLSHRYKLVSKEKQFMAEAKYLPILYWYSTVAEYMEGSFSDEKMEQTIIKSGNLLIKNDYKISKIKELLAELTPILPANFERICKGLEM
ncbi:MAG TPA: hypothetical protein DCQ31_18110 [Bacteroidales bacterium]|nr:hypothetical protein [Bacteroidales bacterium]